MRKHLLIGLLSLLFLPLIAFAEDFQLGRDYKIVASPQPPADKKTVEVIEFFSYGCPGCNTIEPTLQIWLVTKPKDVTFGRIPAIFHTEWYPLAKAYFVAKNLNIANRITPPLFKAIHTDHQNLDSEETLSFFFQKQGVKADDFAGNYDFSPIIDAQITRGDALMRQYGIYQIPTFVVNGTYQTDFGMAAGDSKRLMKIVDFLIAKQGVPVVAAKAAAVTPATKTTLPAPKAATPAQPKTP